MVSNRKVALTVTKIQANTEFRINPVRLLGSPNQKRDGRMVKLNRPLRRNVGKPTLLGINRLPRLDGAVDSDPGPRRTCRLIGFMNRGVRITPFKGPNPFSIMKFGLIFQLARRDPRCLLLSLRRCGTEPNDDDPNPSEPAWEP